MNVLSLFDGMSCGQIALNKCRIEYYNYFASEIDKNAIKITQSNYPNTIQLGDVKQIDFASLPKIDLLLAGSPCQDISNLNKTQLGLEGEKSSLFYYFLSAKHILNPTYWLLENVDGKKESLHTICKELKVRPYRFNANLVSAQNRKRLFWSNIIVTTIPKNKRLQVASILENEVEDKYYQSDSWNTWWIANREFQLSKGYSTLNATKAACLTARMYASWNGNFIQDEKGIRRLSTIECERLQGVPDGYTKSVSDTEAYKMLGNGWNIDIISHIFKHIK